MKNSNRATLLKHAIPKHVELSSIELDELLNCFTTDRQKRIISGIANNPGMLSHAVCQNFYCTYIPSFVQSVAEKLTMQGLKIICIKPEDTKYYNSHQWYLCLIGEVEQLDTVAAANDMMFL